MHVERRNARLVGLVDRECRGIGHAGLDDLVDGFLIDIPVQYGVGHHVDAGAGRNGRPVDGHCVGQHGQALGMSLLDQRGQRRLVHACIVDAGAIAPAIREHLDRVRFVVDQFIHAFFRGEGRVDPFRRGLIAPVGAVAVGRAHARGEVDVRAGEAFDPAALRIEGFGRLGEIEDRGHASGDIGLGDLRRGRRLSAERIVHVQIIEARQQGLALGVEPLDAARLLVGLVDRRDLAVLNDDGRLVGLSARCIENGGVDDCEILRRRSHRNQTCSHEERSQTDKSHLSPPVQRSESDYMAVGRRVELCERATCRRAWNFVANANQLSTLAFEFGAEGAGKLQDKTVTSRDTECCSNFRERMQAQSSALRLNDCIRKDEYGPG